MYASGGLIIFVKQSLSFFKFSTSFLSLLDSYSDYVGVNISLNNSSLLSFLHVYAPLFTLLQQIAEPTPFLPPFFPLPEISSFWGLQLPSPPLGLKKVLSTPVGKKYLMGSFPLTSFPSMTLTYLLFSIAPLAVATLQISPLLPLLLASLAPGRCFRTWVLITYKFY